MNLSHFSDSPIERVFSVPPSQGELLFLKPQGLWLSVDGEDDWVKWCEGEDFRTILGQYHYRIILKKDANVLHLKSAAEIKDFHKKYKKGLPLFYRRLRCFLNWPAVMADYDGIIIAPYCWNLRLDPEVMWYYSWDCASGCIWNADAVERLELVREPVEKV